MNRDIASLHNILSAGNLILDFNENKTFSDFEDDSMLNSAVCRQLEIIGEATKRLSKEIREENANIPWREMAELIDIISHGMILLIIMKFGLFVKILFLNSFLIWRGFKSDDEFVHGVR